MTEGESSFDFERHGQAAVTSYLARRAFFEDLAMVVRRILEEALKDRRIDVHSVQARAKDPTSFGRKASTPSDVDPAQPKYLNPLEQITDLAGVRVIAYFPSILDSIDRLITDEFQIIERSNKGSVLIEEDRFGYQSIHYLVTFKPERSILPEYRAFASATTEIQIRTILQHAWAEIEHDIQYKSASVLPTEIRRRFMALAGMLEIADREFQAIQDEYKRLTAKARSQIAAGRLEDVEITPDAVKAFLDRRLGPDGRIADFSYQWTVRLLRRLGFRTLEQVEKCIQSYDDDRLSRVVSGSRQGQTTRFEFMLTAGMGENFYRRHIWADQPWWKPNHELFFELLRNADIEIREYDPLSD